MRWLEKLWRRAGPATPASVDQVRALAAAGDAAAIPALARALDRPALPPDTVLWALGRLDPAAEALGRVLLDRHPGRAGALLARARDPVAALVDQLAAPLPAAPVLQALARCDARAVPPLAAALAHRDARVAARAARALGAIGRVEGLDPLARHAAHRHPRVRARVEAALERVARRDPDAARLALHDADPLVALAVLARLGDRAALAPLAAFLGDPDPERRARAARLLGRLGAPEATDALAGRLTDPAPAVREAATRALGRLGDARAVPHLALRLDEGEPAGVRFAAVAALRGLRRHAADAVLEAVDDPRRRFAALIVLQGLDPDDGALARRLAAHADEDVRAVAPRLCRLCQGAERRRERADVLAALLADPSPRVRRRAVDAAEHMGDAFERFAPALRRAADDADDRVRHAAAWVLGRLRPPG